MNSVPATLEKLPARILGGWGGEGLAPDIGMCLYSSQVARSYLGPLDGHPLPALHHLRMRKELS